LAARARWHATPHQQIEMHAAERLDIDRAKFAALDAPALQSSVDEAGEIPGFGQAPA
jgi:hypothetical protein